MKEISKTLKSLEANNAWQVPHIFDLRENSDLTKFAKLLDEGSIHRVHDKIEVALGELYDIANPSRKDVKTENDLARFKLKKTSGKPREYGVWVYYPWSGDLVHFPPRNDLRKLRTARNRNLILQDEQDALYKATVLIAGLSVGSSVVEMLSNQGIGGRFILVDMDVIEPTNLNRIKLPYKEVGVHKVDAMAKRLSETDPFIEQVHFRDGLTEKNIAQIIQTHKPDIIIDEIDDLQMKFVLREYTAKHRLPLVMATDDGENALLDIERYDTNPSQQPFEGRISEELRQKVIKGELSRPELGMLIGKHFVGAENIPLRMFESLVEVGKTIPSWPQLAGAATLSGVTLAYAVKKIILGQPLNNGRHLFDLDASLDPQIHTKEYKKKLEAFQKLFFA